MALSWRGMLDTFSAGCEVKEAKELNIQRRKTENHNHSEHRVRQEGLEQSTVQTRNEFRMYPLSGV